MEAGIISTEGRIRRTTFWLRWLFGFIINVSLRLILEVVNTPGAFLFIGSIILIVSAFVFIQGIKRMHDINKSGWYFLIPLYNIILCLEEGTRGPNAYGDDPKDDGTGQYTPYIAVEKPAL